MALRSTHLIVAIGTASILGLAGRARAATLSFASDDDSGAFTLRSIQDNGFFRITNGRAPNFTPVTLKVDDDNMSQPTFSIAAGLLVDLNANYVGSVGVGQQTHLYNILGTFSFVRASDQTPLVNVQVFSGSTLAINGTATTWGSAGSFFGSDTDGVGMSNVLYETLGLQFAMSDAGLNPNLYGFSFTNSMEDFSFTMTMVNAGGGPVAIDPTTHQPTAAWQAEASYSGHVVGIPAPGAGVGLAVGGLIGWRRRRR